MLAEVYERTDDRERADLFARVALESESSPARARASAVLERSNANRTVQESLIDNTFVAGDAESERQRDEERIEVRHSQRVRASPPPLDVNAPVEAWFDYAKHQLLQRRTPTFGVRSLHSTVDMLLDCALALATKPSVFSQTSLPLSRGGLEQIDQTVLEMRKSHAPGSAARTDAARTHGIAGFLLAVVLHELQGTALETAPNDGGCKVIVGSRAGARPLLVARAFEEGTGPGLTQTYDRLAASLELAGPSSPQQPRVRTTQPFDMRAARRQAGASGPVAVPSPSNSSALPPPSEYSPGSTAPPTTTLRSLPAMPRVSLVGATTVPISHVPRASGRVSSSMVITAAAERPELASTRPEVEAQPVRRLDGTFRSADVPPMDLAALASSFADSALGGEIAARSGTRLSPNPANVEALESYLSTTRGRAGTAPELAAWQPSDRDEGLIVSCGAFLGETIIATYGGIWECDPNAPTDPRLFRVVCHDRIAAWPITQVYLRLKAGATHDLVEFLARVGQVLKVP